MKSENELGRTEKLNNKLLITQQLKSTKKKKSLYVNGNRKIHILLAFQNREQQRKTLDIIPCGSVSCLTTQKSIALRKHVEGD